MEITNGIFFGLGGLPKILWMFFSNWSFLPFPFGGWVLLVIFFVAGLWHIYKKEIEHQFVHSQDWVFLKIKVPRENLVSTLAVESIFAQMHALHGGLTFGQIHIEGRIQLWYSLEIVSFGGKVSFIIRAPERTKNLVEAAIYAQYPDAEITAMSDYMEKIFYTPQNEEFDLWGTEWKLEYDDVIPIKTYKDFQDPAAEEKIVEPLSPLFEALAKIEPHEFFGIQILIHPLSDPEWKPRGELKVKELTGEEIPHQLKFSSLLMAPLNWFADFSYKKFLLGDSHSAHGGDEIMNKPRSNWMSLTDTEKLRVGLIEKKIGKPGYKTKIRFLYISPKDKMDLSKRMGMVGAYRTLGSDMTNKIKPDLKKTWTGADWNISPELEKPYLDYVLARKKSMLFKGYKQRDIHIGLPQFILNTEEIATLFHFPLTNMPMSASVQKTEVKKSQAPVDLPIVEDYI